MNSNKYMPLKILEKAENPILDSLSYIDRSSPDAYKQLQMQMIHLLPKEWGKTKKVYCPDEDFVEVLVDTENVKVYPHLMKNIPFPFVYIDLAYCEAIPIVGIFLSVDIEEDNSIKLFFMTIGEKERISGSIHTLPVEKGKQDNGFLYYELNREQCHTNADKYNSQTGEFETYDVGDKVASNVLFFIYQFLLYISTPAADIKENEFSKKHYKPSQSNKIRVSAVQKWDVGIRCGNKFRKRKGIEEEFDFHQKIKQASKRPHVRCAHWQHYRVGTGRKEIILKWIEPVFVNGNIDDIVTTVIPVSEQESIGYVGEVKIEEYLQSKNINYKSQRYVGIIGKRYDVSFRIDDEEYLVEFDGEQHFKVVECWGGEDAYLKRIEADVQKTDYCRRNKIPLLRIRYDQISLIAQMIDDFIAHKHKYLKRFNSYMTDEEYYEMRE